MNTNLELIDQALDDLHEFNQELKRQDLTLTPLAAKKLNNAVACLQIASSPRSEENIPDGNSQSEPSR